MSEAGSEVYTATTGDTPGAVLTWQVAFVLTLLHYKAMSPEAEQFIATGPSHREGLRQLATMLPPDDAQLDEWLMKAGGSGDEITLSYLMAAACISGRRLNASILPFVLSSIMAPVHTAWAALRMEGDVMDSVLHALNHTKVKPVASAYALFIAAEWWHKNRGPRELPQQITWFASELAKDEKLELEALVMLRALSALPGGEPLIPKVWIGVKPHRLALEQKQQLKEVRRMLDRPFDQLVCERRNQDFISTAPRRRAVAKVGPNEQCPCGSGKKYKKCCKNNDRERLSHSSSVAGITREELRVDPLLRLTKEGIKEMNANDLLCIDPKDVAEELQADYVFKLADEKNYYDAVNALKQFSKTPDGKKVLPAHLHDTWRQLLAHAEREWEPYIGKQLIELFPDAFEKLGITPDAGTRFLLEGTKKSDLLLALEIEVIKAVVARDLQDLQSLTRVLLRSHYKAIGLLFARSLLPLVEEKEAADLYEGILAARAHFDLPPDDEFNEWMNQKALRKALEYETEAVQKAQDALAKRSAEARRVNEERAQLQRQVSLLEKRERERQDSPRQSASADEQTEAKLKEVNAKLDRVQSLAREKGEAELKARRELERVTRQNEELKAAVAESSAADEEDEGREEFAVSGNQAPRLIAFPRGFHATLEEVKPHVARAAMNRLGRLSAGEAAAFDKLKAIVALPGVLEARISDRYRLLFTLLPRMVRVVDLVYRADLDKAIERYKITGLPRVPEVE